MSDWKVEGGDSWVQRWAREREEAGNPHLCGLRHPSPPSPPVGMGQSRAGGLITLETCSLGLSAGLLSLAGPELLVMPTKSLQA